MLNFKTSLFFFFRTTNSSRRVSTTGTCTAPPSLQSKRSPRRESTASSTSAETPSSGSSRPGSTRSPSSSSRRLPSSSWRSTRGCRRSKPRRVTTELRGICSLPTFYLKILNIDWLDHSVFSDILFYSDFYWSYRAFHHQ